MGQIRGVVRRHLAVLVLVGVVFVICIVNQRPGHDWGDDFALYLNQSRALVEGDVGEVLAVNRFTVQESSWSTFSPYSYPWGTPMLLSPVVAIWGLDYPKLKLVETVFFAGFLLVFYLLVVRRVGQIGGLVLVSLIGFSVSFVGWTDVVLSEMPYLFFIVMSLWWLDRLGDRGAWEKGPLRQLVTLGLLIGFTFSIRREGMVLVLALAVAQGAYLWRRRRREGEPPTPPIPWKRLSVPHATAAGFVIGLQLLLPSVLFQRYPETGLHRVVDNALWFRDILAEHIGLTGPGVSPWEYFGSNTLAVALFMLFIVFAVLGVVVRSLNHGSRDGPLVALLFGSMLVVGIQPFHEGRYLMAITPFLAYFAYQGIASTIGDALSPSASKRARSIPGLLAVAFILLLTMGNASHLYDRTSYRIEYGGWTHWGPEDPAALDMFAAVRERTRRDEVLAFFRARAMNLYAERRTLQLTRVDHILARADWYVMEKDSTYSQVLLTAEEGAEAGLSVEWENDRFVLWRVPER